MLGLYEAIQRAPLAQPPDAPASPQLRALLDALLAKDPAARPGLEQVAAHAWVSKGGAAPLAITTVPAPVIMIITSGFRISTFWCFSITECRACLGVQGRRRAAGHPDGAGPQYHLIISGLRVSYFGALSRLLRTPGCPRAAPRRWPSGRCWAP